MKNRSDFDLDIAVIALPHLANFDDFDPFEREPKVRLRYVEANDALGEPDLIILPGTKSTVADLAHLRARGRDQEVIRQVSLGAPIIGICGGYQMLGVEIRDPEGVESARPVTGGLSLLPVTSRFLPVKSTHQVKGRTIVGRGILAKAQDAPISGYEIHMGQTSALSAAQPFSIEQRSGEICAGRDGSLSEDGNVLGTYIHGLFHNDDLRRAILSEIAERKGKVFSPMTSSFSVEDQYDRLAAHVRENLNMDLIYRLLDSR
jgi:adenosylcobyric acid synthase